MKKTVKRIFILFMAVILLPSVFTGLISFSSAAEEAPDMYPMIDIDTEAEFL